jgi:hypothetical protein
MALQPSGQITLSDIQDEFGGANPIGMSEYYRGGAYTTSNNTNVPTSGAISVSDFYSATAAVAVTYELIGGGGAGGQGYATSGTSADGTSSSISGTGFTTATSAGGTGGVDRSLFGATSGSSSYYGSGGAAGITSDNSNDSTAGSDASATSYGAGGGGGGGYPFSAYNAGGGGEAATRVASSQNIAPGTELTVVVGAKGPRGSSAGLEGGAGAGGYVKITVGGVATEYTTAGTYTYTVPS